MSRKKSLFGEGKKDDEGTRSTDDDAAGDRGTGGLEGEGGLAEAFESAAPPPEVLVPEAPEEETRKTSISSRIASTFSSVFAAGSEKTTADSPAALAEAAHVEAPAPRRPKRAPFNGQIVSEPSADGYVWVRLRGNTIRKLHARGECRRLGTDGPDGPYVTCEIPVEGLEQ